MLTLAEVRVLSATTTSPKRVLAKEPCRLAKELSTEAAPKDNQAGAASLVPASSNELAIAVRRRPAAFLHSEQKHGKEAAKAVHGLKVPAKKTSAEKNKISKGIDGCVTDHDFLFLRSIF